MKKFILMLICGFAFSVSHLCAQEPTVQPYWNIENNIKSPKQSIVYFYSASHELMYKENIENRKLNVGNKKTLRLLNAALNEVLISWQTVKGIKENEQIIAQKL